MELAKFENVELYIASIVKKNGTVYIREYALANALYFCEEGITTEDPWKENPLAVNPQESPFQFGDGHYLFDLGFYSEITHIENPPRVCFHDPNQENIIALNFSAYSDFQDFIKEFGNIMTVNGSQLPGFYELVRFQPPLSSNPNFSKLTEKMISDALSLPFDSEGALESHTEIIAKIMPTTKTPITLADESIVPLDDVFSLKEFLKLHTIPDNMKGDVWRTLIGFRTISDYSKEQYLKLRWQWKIIPYTQYLRSASMRKLITTLADVLAKSKSKLNTVISNPSINVVVFDVLMSLTMQFSFLEDHFPEMIYILRVFLWMFIKDIHKDNDKLTFTTPSDETLDLDQMETILYWSLLFILEKGEVKRLFLTSRKKGQTVTESIHIFIFYSHPQIFRLLAAKGVDSLEQLSPLLMTHFASLLPICDTADIWIAAIASPSFFEFSQSIIIGCLFFEFPNLIGQSLTNSPVDLNQHIDRALNLMTHYYLMAVASIMLEKKKELVGPGLSGL